MKRQLYFLSILSVLSILCGYLLSKATLIGRFGMTFIYREYAFLKTWWKGGLFVFVVWITLYFLLGVIQRKLSLGKAKRVQIGIICLALLGLFLTYLDFRNTLSHRLLGERFHLGGYLFWVGWMLVGFYRMWTASAAAQIPSNNHQSIKAHDNQSTGADSSR